MEIAVKSLAQTSYFVWGRGLGSNASSNIHIFTILLKAITKIPLN